MADNPDNNIPKPRSELDSIFPRVYDELRRFASQTLQNERQDHTFQTTELVHETYVRLARLNEIKWTNQDHIVRAAVGVMRRVLIDYARARGAKKRDVEQLFLNCPSQGFSESVDDTPAIDLLALDEALRKLHKLDDRKTEIVELRYFGGQNIESVARILGISTATVKRDWALAKAWLFRELSEDTIKA